MKREEAKKYILSNWSTSDGKRISKMVNKFGKTYIYKKKPKEATHEEALDIFK